MGSATSKPETKSFTPKAPVDYSASFLSHLEKSLESDYTRAQFAEHFIQERVADELRKLEAEAIAKLKQTTADSTPKEVSEKLPVKSSDERIEALSKRLRENSSAVSPELSETITNARNSVISCMKDNSGRFLNCWDEVNEFKKLINSM